MSTQALKSLVYHAGLYAASVSTLKLAGFVFYLWLARSLTVVDYAIWGLLYALQTATAAFGVVGIGEATVGLLKANRSSGERATLFAAANFTFLLTLAASLAIGALLAAASLKLGEGSLLALAGATASGALLAYTSLQAQLLRLAERHHATLYFAFVAPFIGLCASAIAFYFHHSVESFYLGATAGLGASVLLAKGSGIGIFGWSTQRRDWMPVATRIVPFIPVALLAWLSGYGNNYLIQVFLGSHEVARFTFVYILASTMQLLASAMNQVWSPRFYRVMHELPPGAVEQHNRYFSILQAMALGITGAVLVAMYPDIIRMTGRNLIHYETMTEELVLLLLGYIVLIPWWHCSNYFLAHDKGARVMQIYIATSVLGLGILVALLLLFGPIGIYAGFFIHMALRGAGSYVVARRYWPVRLNLDGIALGAAALLVGLAASHSGMLRLR